MSNTPKLSRFSKGFRVFLALLFSVFAFTQFNDPDPLLWISIYGTMAVLMIVSIFKRVPQLVLGIIAGILIVYLVVLVPEIISWINKGMPSIVESMSAEEPHIEYAREFFGVVICLAGLWYLGRGE